MVDYIYIVHMKEIKLTKKRARNEIFFKPDKDDDWFIHIIHKEKSTDKKRSVMIIQKDMDAFLQHYLQDGWIIETADDKKDTKTKSIKKK